MKIKSISKKTQQAVAILLAVVLLVTLVVALTSKAAAVESLSHIEAIKQAGKEFNIVEIVPTADSGSIGYYVKSESDEPSYEPTANWKTDAGKVEPTETETGPQARTKYANGVFANLHKWGLMSDEVADTEEKVKAQYDAYPLTFTGNYSEALPWTEGAAVGAEAVELKNNKNETRYESVTENGTFSAHEGGAFSVSSTAKLNTEIGTYVQNITKFVYGQATDGKSYYYYTPEFKEVKFITNNDVVAAGKMPLYKLNDDGKTYEYLGTNGVGGYVVKLYSEDDLTTHYYTVETTGVPSESHYPDVEAENKYTYYAVPNEEDPYRFVGTGGYFVLDTESYKYVGNGKGSFDFNPLEGDDNHHTVSYSTIYIKNTSGYTNNNWLLRKVFDVDDLTKCNLKVKVHTVVLGEADAEAVYNTIDFADMIVVSAGFDITKSTQENNSFISKFKAGTTDLRSYSVKKEDKVTIFDPVELIQNKITNDKLPVILDGRLKDESLNSNDNKTNIYNLANSLIGKNTAPFVSGSLYCFMPDDNKTPDNSTDDRFSLATGNFILPFDESLYKTQNSNYYEVFSTIEYENFLRDRLGEAKLPENVTVANCVRHIINYSGQLQKFNKTAISVLDIEPMTQIDQDKDKSGTVEADEVANSARLNEGTVRGWLPAGSGITDVEIDTMSMAEFVTKINDICEDYDLVYIGASLDNMNVDKGQTVYNDLYMNGLIYSNIGDTYKGTSALSGLVGTDIYRFSGNDLTQTRGKALQSFIDSGFPVVIADDLVESTAGTGDEQEMSVNIQISQTDYNILWGQLDVEYTFQMSVTKAPDLPNLKFLWFKGNTLIGAGRVFDYSTRYSNDPGGDYYCIAYVVGTKDSAKSNVIQATHEGSWLSGWRFISTGDNGTVGAISATVQDSLTISMATVDSCSNLYSVLSANSKKNNVMAAATAVTYAEVGDTTLLKYLNLSKPSIVFSDDVDSKPKEYNGNCGDKCLADTELSYTFTINNVTDPTPNKTRYTCSLYIDQNADGRYRDNEQISDLTVYEKVNGQYNNKIPEDALQAGKTYKVIRHLPTTYQGLIPWHLEVTQNDTEGLIHASQSDYTYYKPTKAQNLNILQITSVDTMFKDDKYKGDKVFSLRNNFNLDNDLKSTTVDATGDKTYLDLFEQLKNAGLYNITVDTISVSALNGKDKDTIANLFKGYNMLIIGFGDSYGSNENSKGLDEESAEEITKFIDTGKAVLFTHDTTSFVNTSSNDGWGYYFNSIVRDPVGLDRYGVTNTVHKDSVKHAGSVTNIDSFANEMQKDGYSVAYTPKNTKVDNRTLANETQGYTAMTLMRFAGEKAYGFSKDCNVEYNSDTTNYGINATNKVTQTNKGQITTYPYLIDETLTVAPTHEQYYQLNMNSDDTVVWYCLSGTDDTLLDNDGDNVSVRSHQYTDYFKNDGTNAYYIYNRGNVTYSGAGHTVHDKGHASFEKWDIFQLYPNYSLSDLVVEQEAKLFVNTMIAAFRAGAVNPNLTFMDASANPVSTQLMPIEYASAGASTAVAVQADTRVYFQISDDNLTSDKEIGIEFYSYPGSVTVDKEKPQLPAGGTKLENVDVHLASNNDKVTGSLKSNTLYYIVLPDSTANIDSTVVTLLGRAVTTIGGQPNYGFNTLPLTKIGYMMLR